MQLKVLVPLANGFEEIETMTIIDVLRRAQIDVIVASIDEKHVTGAHGVVVMTQTLISQVRENELDMVILPGGMPGADNLRKCKILRDIIQKLNVANKPIGAICAAPWVLYEMGVLKDNYTCYPSFEERISRGEYHRNKNIVNDQNIITATGPATAMEFALEIVKALKGKEIYQQVKSRLLFN